MRDPVAFLLCTFSLLGAVLGAPGSGSRVMAEEAAPERISVAELAASPEAYLGRTVAVQGRLENLGTNYFTDIRVVLRGRNGNVIDVLPWLPLEFPPSPPGATRPRPRALSDYLGKEVVLVGTLVRSTIRGVGAVDVFRVDVAEVLP